VRLPEKMAVRTKAVKVARMSKVIRRKEWPGGTEGALIIGESPRARKRNLPVCPTVIPGSGACFHR
jgi:hypothetical protein